MGQGHLIDSNVIIDYTALRLPTKGSDFVEQIFNTGFIISVAVKIEVLGFANLPDKMKAMEEFVDTQPFCHWTKPLPNRPSCYEGNTKN